MSQLRNFDTQFSLTGKTALVTGGSRGLGLHMATGFLRAGCSLVVVTARKLEGEQGINQAVDRLNALPGIKGRAVGLAANVGDTEGIKALASQVGELCEKVAREEGGTNRGGLNIVVCNAGASWGSHFVDAPPHSSTKILDLNVRGVFELVQQ